MSLREIIEKKNKQLRSIPENFLSDIEKTEKEVYTKLLTLINRLQTGSDGRILITKSNISIAADIASEIKSIVLNGEYIAAIVNLTKDIDRQAVLTDKYFAKAFGSVFKESDVANAVLEQSKKAAIDILTTSVPDNFKNEISGLLNDAVSSGTSITDLTNQIKDYSITSENNESKLYKYASETAHDATAYSDRAYTNIIGEELDAEWYLYSGTEQENSRCFCEERKGKYFHFKEIEAFGRGEDIGDCKVGTHWQGADPNTNEQTIFIVAGGFSCIDSILPVSVSVVPIDVIQRAIDKGYYEPSEKEAELLGL